MSMFLFQCERQVTVLRRSEFELSREEVIADLGDEDFSLEELQEKEDDELAILWIQWLERNGLGLHEVGSEEDLDEDPTYTGEVAYTVQET